MNEEKIITPQIVYVDEWNRIMGITSLELGVEVITEINCSCALTEDGFAKYKYVDGEVIERTEEEIEADRQASLKAVSPWHTTAYIKYRKDGNRVFIVPNKKIKPTGTKAIIGTMPTEYRPAEDVKSGVVTVRTNGNVELLTDDENYSFEVSYFC